METILTIIKHLFSFLTVILTVFLGLSFTKLERKKHPILKIADGKKLRFFIAIIFCGGIIAVLNFREDMKDSNSKVVLEGEIASQKLVKPYGYLNIVIGDTPMKITTNEYQHGHPIKPFMHLCGSDYEITFRKGKNRVLISAEITSIDGKIVAEIIDNEWRINPNNYFKKTYSDQRLEIIDNYNLPILRVEVNDENIITVQGVFITKDNTIVATQNGTAIIGGKPSLEKIRSALKSYEIK